MPSKSKWQAQWERGKSRGLPSRSKKINRREYNVFVKFCKPEHNLLNGCPTIQLGTLEYYRELDPSFAIADAHEGKDTIHVNSFESDTASQEAVDALKGFAFMGPGSSMMYSIVKKTVPNCFIWCCSRANKPISREQGTRLDPNYTDHYEIPSKNLDSFGQQLGQLLVNFIGEKSRLISASSDTGITCFQNLPPGQRMDGIYVNMIHFDVVYVNEKTSVIQAGQLHSYDNRIPPQLRSLFAKAKRYEKDNEHRYVFRVYDKDGRQLSVRKEPLLLQIDSTLRHLIS